MCATPRPKIPSPTPPIQLPEIEPGGAARDEQIQRKKLGKRRLQISLGSASGVVGTGLGISKK